MFKIGCLIILLVFSGHQVSAEIITDGTLGTPLNLLSPDFQIEAQ